MNGDGIATLGDVAATGWNYENDELRLLNPANSVSTMKFLWLTAAEAEELEVGDKAGWYDDEDYEYQNSREFDLGSGFLTSLGSKGVSFTYSGQVYDQAFTIDCAGRKYNVIPNALPRDITLGEISATGWNYENDELRLLNPANSVSTMKFLWLTAAEAEELEVGDKAGWYDDEDYEYQASFSVSPACGFLTSLGSKSVKINLPAAINTL